jgi:hypothetical protein
MGLLQKNALFLQEKKKPKELHALLTPGAAIRRNAKKHIAGRLVLVYNWEFIFLDYQLIKLKNA